jgi:hypothetical protein
MVLILVGSLATASAAGAQADDSAYEDDNGTTVIGTDFERTTTEPLARTEVRGTTVTRAQELPVTGGDVLGLALIGLAAVGVGVGLTRAARRRRDLESPA